MNKYFLALLLLIASSLYAEEWRTGDYKITLTQDKQGDWVNENCLKTCPLEDEGNKYLRSHHLSAEDLRGGKNPGSVLCHRLQGKVIYLESRSIVQAFCQLSKNTVSLSKLARVALNNP